MGMDNIFVGFNNPKYLLFFESAKITAPTYDGLF